ncbi:acyl-CoA dehydrogenase [Rickenella mellea]|uniref:Acyl-CoA dehydrogenase n=1 Tax=Rickenella mellea TaxID=50990 RepID=A0A4Y7PWT5_9AGAM|nr:acyl-CoA dehydrogenase [Rickenella mellea]
MPSRSSLDNPHPFGEPAWTTSLLSPFYRDSHHRLRLHLREYLETKLFPHAFEWEQRGLRRLLIPGLPPKYRCGKSLPGDIPDEEWDLFHSMIVSDEFHRCPHMGVMWGLTSGNTIGCPPIINFGNEEQKSKYLPQVCNGELRFCLAITEPEAGSDVAGIRTTATLDSSGQFYVVSGQKKWITNGLWADYATTAVRTGGSGASGISVLIIPLKDTPGVSVRRMMNSGLHASGSTFIVFSDVRVPRANLIGRENGGFKIIMANFNPERLSLATGALRLARTCYSEAYAHALRRKTFGKPLMENQIIRAKFASMARHIETCYSWIEQLIFHMQNTPRAEEDPQLGARLALAKVQAGKTLELCCREAQQIFGGLGVNKEGLGAVVEQISRDMRVWVVGGGSEEIMDEQGMRLVMEKTLRTQNPRL